MLRFIFACMRSLTLSLLVIVTLTMSVAVPVHGQVPTLELVPDALQVQPNQPVSFSLSYSDNLGSVTDSIRVSVTWSDSASFVPESAVPSPSDVTATSITWTALTQPAALPSFILLAGSTAGLIEVRAELQIGSQDPVQGTPIEITISDLLIDTPTLTATASPTSTSTPSVTLTASPSPTPSATPTLSPSASPTSTSSPIAVETWTPTSTPTFAPTAPAIVTPTVTPTTPALTPEGGGGTTTNDMKGLLTIGIVALLAALVAGIVLLLLLRGRRKSPPPPEAAPVAPVQPEPGTVTTPLPTSGATLESVAKAGLRLRLGAGTTTIGRAPDSTICIDETYMNWETVSRKHAEIRREGDSYVIYDVSNRNGVYVEGRRTARNVLHPGWRIGIGGVEFIFRDVAAEQ